MFDTPRSTSPQIAGTHRWTSPELLLDTDLEPTTASDVWALGMTILQVFTGRYPYSHLKNDLAVIMSVVQGQLPPQPPEIDGVMWALLERCFSFDPVKPPRVETVSTILNIMVFERLTPGAINRLVDHVDAMQHEIPMSSRLPCFWSECRAQFDTLTVRRAHLVQHWYQWVSV